MNCGSFLGNSFLTGTRAKIRHGAGEREAGMSPSFNIDLSLYVMDLRYGEKVRCVQEYADTVQKHGAGSLERLRMMIAEE